MTLAAWIMLVSTWAVIVFFTARFLWKVVAPRRRRDGHGRG